MRPLAALLLLVSACGGGAPEEEPASGRPRIALIMKSLANEFFSTMAEGARAHHAAHAGEYELVVNGIKDERDLARQVALVEERIAEGVDAIVIAPADSKALVGVLRRAVASGIAVVNIDNRLDEDVMRSASLDVPFVGPDNREGARAVGEVLARELAPGDAVAILEGVPSADNAVQRRLGFEDAMESAGIEVVDSQSAQWEMDAANRIAAAMLSEHENLQGILASNDSMALGALAAVRAAGKLGEVRIVGFDNISAIRDAVKSGAVLATADQHADRLAVYGIEVALELLRGETTPDDRKTPVEVVTADSLR